MKNGGNFIAKDSVTVYIGIVYISLIILQWITQFLPYNYAIWNPVFLDYVYYNSIFILNGSTWVFLILGAVLLIPCFILNIIFIASSQGTKSGKAGFGLGAAAWVYLVIAPLSIYLDPNHLILTPYVPLLSAILTICLIIFGILLFTRAFKIQSRINQEFLSSLSTPSPGGPPRLRASSSDYLVGPPCPDCNKTTKYDAQYDRYYCLDCKKYLES
ncbi:MAG: hypothetical protein LUQ65_02475 [Candidatus Helarchaeota archaeon]|nr:hypothetical protein [Candidatus Helarchaeota archaeon]